MTDLSPERLAEIRAWTTDDVSVLPRHSGPTNAEIRALCDALAAAEKERDDEAERAGNIVRQQEEIRKTHHEEWKCWHDMMLVLEKERDAARAALAAPAAEPEEKA